MSDEGASLGEESFWQPGQPRDVYLYIYIKTLLNVDTIAQNYTIAFFVSKMWKPSRKEYERIVLGQSDDGDTEDVWIPIFTFYNQLEEMSSTEVGRPIRVIKEGARDAWNRKVFKVDKNLPNNFVFFSKTSLTIGKYFCAMASFFFNFTFTFNIYLLLIETLNFLSFIIEPSKLSFR